MHIHILKRNESQIYIIDKNKIKNVVNEREMQK